MSASITGKATVTGALTNLSTLNIFIAWMGDKAHATAIQAAKTLRNAGFHVAAPDWTEIRQSPRARQQAQLPLRPHPRQDDRGRPWNLKTLTDGSQQKLTEPALLKYCEAFMTHVSAVPAHMILAIIEQASTDSTWCFLRQAGREEHRWSLCHLERQSLAGSLRQSPAHTLLRRIARFRRRPRRHRHGLGLRPPRPGQVALPRHSRPHRHRPVVFDKESQPAAHAKAEQARSEFVVAVEGKVIEAAKSECRARHRRSRAASPPSSTF